MNSFANNSKYKSSDRIKFGQYKDIEIGIIFLYDPQYLEWLITDVIFFCVEDLDLLQKNGVINSTIWLSKFKIAVMQKDNMQKFSSYARHLKEFEAYLQEYKIADKTLEKNKENITSDGKWKIKINSIKR